MMRDARDSKWSLHALPEYRALWIMGAWGILAIQAYYSNDQSRIYRL